MKKLLILTVVVFLYTACSSGYKAYKKGDYFKATVDAVDKLKSSPSNEKASFVLSKTYPMALQTAKREINNAKLSNQPGNYEQIVEKYEQLNFLASTIYGCPAALEIIKQPEEFITELSDAKNTAAAQTYEMGLKNLETGTLQSARIAYNQFLRTNNYVYGFSNVLKLIEEARFQGTMRIVVEKPQTSMRYQYSADFFSSNLIAEITRTLEKRMIQFYNYDNYAASFNEKPHQYLVLNFEDFSIGNIFDSQQTIDLKKDSVHVGYANINGKKVDVYNTVTARLTTFRREIKSGGILSVKIFDQQNRMIEQRNFSGEYVWYTSWAKFNGDERALTSQQKRLCELQPVMAPSQQYLFTEFTKPIYSQAVNYIKQFYYKY